MPDLRPAGDHAPLPARAGTPVRRVLVVASQTATSAVLVSALRDRAARAPVCFHLVVPALNGRLRHWLSDVDDALSAARRRAEDSVAVLSSHGLTVSAEVGDSVPLLAIEDVLSQFPADEIVISTLPPSSSHWLEQGLVERARDRFAIPIAHVVADEAILPRQGESSRRRRSLTGQLGRRRETVSRNAVPARSQSSAAGLPPTAARVRSRRG
ncbi:MAG TPA: hypothetical protein VGL69_16140 [Solirubrobacteraceae bacterium]|jgi:hypothetical protein